jgi:hypothetical protein
LNKSKYREGPEVAKEFENAMKTLFHTPKPEVKKKQEATSRKEKNRDKD